MVYTSISVEEIKNLPVSVDADPAAILLVQVSFIILSPPQVLPWAAAGYRNKGVRNKGRKRTGSARE